ncbi:MAG TPA: tetratricopeptide repeat protein [Terriglobales bacterium]|jgi:tetratricopeptide (TPR) repeat protein|nr:tetratricopeptide repeat protein [Terriglobales bacterium]
MRPSRRFSIDRLLFWLVGFLTVSAGYLYAFPQTNVFYAIVVVLHAAAGVLAAILLIPALWRYLRSRSSSSTGWALIAVGAIVGLVLLYTGTPRSVSHWLYLHIIVSLAGLGVLMAGWAGQRGWVGSNPASNLLRTAICFAFVAGLSATAWYLRETRWQNSVRIVNPLMPPADMDDEGDGPKGPFFPSSAQVFGGRKIPSKFFMESDSCKRCHEDIYNQWFSSAHHFSSFNNQWYRKSVEYMQDVVGTRPSKWCGGCHDPAVLYSGMMDTPIKQIIHTPEAQAGLGCMMCHAIAEVKSTMGQGDFYLEYPKLHELAASKNPVVRVAHDFLVNLNPEPHRRTFLKPFMRKQTAEFCSSCHKVHLDVPVNHYRWIRGFNEYDNWQASGVSGQGARSFYYPPKAQKCADCHMPLTPSKDAGNIQGAVHSHRFPGANTALPIANEDWEQLKVTEDFLKNKILSVDIFALSATRATISSGAVGQSELSTTFAVGEEAETRIMPAAVAEAVPVTAPLDRVQPAVRRGDSVRVDVVVRTRSVGHFFPGGTVDAFDTWLELKATDDRGQTIFWSGVVEDSGTGPVEKGAHFYRSLLVDARGNPINKRNAWASRAVVYVRLIPPGAADTVHYRLRIPDNAGNHIKLHARLCYRKFAWWNTQFAFAGLPDPNQPKPEVTPDFDDTKYIFAGSTADVSAKQKRIPDLPIVVIAEDEVTLPVVSGPAPQPKVVLQAEDWQRWNDYGIGLLLQGDLKGAQAAFEKVTEVDPKNPDGWVNIGRAAVQEGDMDRARTVLERALSLSPNLARTHFFYAKVLRSEGHYDEAADHLRKVLAQYPRDRVAHNDLGRTLFLQRRYQDAIKEFHSVLTIDPEDLQAHYNLMLCHNGLGNEKQAREHQRRYLRFKADEASQAITGPYRRLNPEDNNERQAIHEHVSAVPPQQKQRRKAAAQASPLQKAVEASP